MAKLRNSSSPALYTDAKVTAATGMPLDSLRRLITWGAVRPAQAGGGRGRVRLWTTRQALRISATSQFVATGFSLQMAHTLTYCFPLDHLVTLYDPETLKPALEQQKRKFPKASTEGTDTLLRMLTSEKQGPGEWPIPGEYNGSDTTIIDRRYLFSDAFGREQIFMAEIDDGSQRVIPYPGGMASKFYDYVLEKELATDVSNIDIRSLLIDRKHLPKKGMPAQVPEPVPSRMIMGDVLCKSRISINLALGFMLCVRALRSLPTRYEPVVLWNKNIHK